MQSTAGWTIPSLGALLSGIHNLSFDGSAGRIPMIYLSCYALAGAGYFSHAVVDLMLSVGLALAVDSKRIFSAPDIALRSLPAFRRYRRGFEKN